MSLGASALIAITLFYIPMRASFDREAEASFRGALGMKAVETEFVLATFSNLTKSLVSRSAIRQALLQHARGELGLEGLRDFTGSRYADGAGALENLIGARRCLPDGTPVAEFGDTDGLPTPSAGGFSPGLAIARNRPSLAILSIEAIAEGGALLGYDLCLYDAAFLLESLPDDLASLDLLAAGAEPAAGTSTRAAAVVRGMPFVLLAEANTEHFERAHTVAFVGVIQYTLGLFVAVSLLSYSTFFRFVRRLIAGYGAMNVRLRKAIAGRELLLKEVHHRIKNNMNTVCSLLELQASCMEPGPAVKALEDASGRVRGMALLYDRLYRGDDFGEVALGELLPPLARDIVAQFPNAGAVTVSSRVGDISIDARSSQALVIIVNELLTNAMKYAFAGRERGTIELEAVGLADGLRLTVRDDGVGMSGEAGGSGFGLMLVDSLVQQLHGTMTTLRDGGTAVVMDLHPEPPAPVPDQASPPSSAPMP